MSKFSKQLKEKSGLAKLIFSDNKMFKYIRSFGLLCLAAGKSKSFDSGEHELGILVLEGTVDLKVDGKTYKNIGIRKTVFDGVPAGMYIPIKKTFKIKSQTDAKLAFCAGICARQLEVCVIEPQNVKVMAVGKDNWAREVRIIIGPNGLSENLILGETINPAGNWSGTPAHKHEINNLPQESLHEELYYFKTDKPQAYGIEKFYSPERKIDELIPLKDGTVTFMPWGYHQIVAGPGYPLYYLFFLSGEGKQLVGVPDGQHDWIAK